MLNVYPLCLHSIFVQVEENSSPYLQGLYGVNIILQMWRREGVGIYFTTKNWLVTKCGRKSDEKRNSELYCAVWLVGFVFTSLSRAWVIYRDDTETRMVPSGLSVAEGPNTAFHNAAHLFSDLRNPLMWIKRRLKPASFYLGAGKIRQSSSNFSELFSVE